MKISLKALFVIAYLMSSFIDLHGQKIEGLAGTWGMFKDKHPDGWGTFKTPYLYLELEENGKYSRAYIHKKSSSVHFGQYEITSDSLIIFKNGIITNGLQSSQIPSDTSKFHSIEDGILEIHEDWKKILGKKIKRWRHKKRFRHLTKEETQKLNLVTSKIINAYSKLE